MLPRTESIRAQRWLSTLSASAGKQTGGIEPTLRELDIDTLGQVVRTLCLYAELWMRYDACEDLAH